jgi:hypothetical protein
VSCVPATKLTSHESVAALAGGVSPIVVVSTEQITRHRGPHGQNVEAISILIRRNYNGIKGENRPMLLFSNPDMRKPQVLRPSHGR